MQRRTSDILLGLFALGLLAIGVFWSTGQFQGSTQSLDRAIQLARVKRFDEAEVEVARFLKSQPRHAAARLLAAQIDLDRTDPKPQEALDFLKDPPANPPEMVAMFRLEQGKAHYYLGDYARAEADWLEALLLNPIIPEAGWALLDLYYVQGRSDDSTALVEKLCRTEPDPRDQILLKLELIRQDARQLAAPLVISRLERALKANPDDIQSMIGLGRALIRDSQLDPGLDKLREASVRASNLLSAWDALLSGLDDAGRNDEFARALEQVPKSIASDPRFLRHWAREAQNRQDWATASDLYQKAWAFRIDQPGVAYRYSRVLRAAGNQKQAELMEQALRRFESGAAEISTAYDAADAIKSHGTEPQPKLYQRLADICERLGRNAQAIAWHQLVLKSDPNDATSKSALARLSNPGLKS